jgi:hypothetical protein
MARVKEREGFVGAFFHIFNQIRRKRSGNDYWGLFITVRVNNARQILRG